MYDESAICDQLLKEGKNIKSSSLVNNLFYIVYKYKNRKKLLNDK